jgi:hypothetical protein
MQSLPNVKWKPGCVDDKQSAEKLPCKKTNRRSAGVRPLAARGPVWCNATFDLLGEYTTNAC